jgi:uncharacterized membrane protein
MENTTVVQNKGGSKRRLAEILNRYWIVWFSILFGVYAGLPFLAPVFMQLGMEGPGRLIYTIYSFLCHQLPERSYFMFGPQTSYSLTEIQTAWQGAGSSNPMILRQFIGNAEMGWKIAWSDRMVWMFTSILLFAWLWWPFRHRIRQLNWIGLILLLLPMAFDGTTHLISDLFGLHTGFRYTNEWLVLLTNGALPASFYLGDALGSFNSYMRLLTGLLFGLATVWFAFPYLHELFSVEVRLAELREKAKEQIYQQVNSPRYYNSGK